MQTPSRDRIVVTQSLVSLFTLFTAIRSLITVVLVGTRASGPLHEDRRTAYFTPQGVPQEGVCSGGGCLIRLFIQACTLGGPAPTGRVKREKINYPHIFQSCFHQVISLCYRPARRIYIPRLRGLINRRYIYVTKKGHFNINIRRRKIQLSEH